MVKDKCGCKIKEVGDELLSLCLDSLGVSAAGRRLQVDPCLPFFLSSLPPYSSPCRTGPGCHGNTGEPSRAREGCGEEEGKRGKRERSGGILSSISVIQREEGVPSCSAAFRSRQIFKRCECTCSYCISCHLYASCISSLNFICLLAEVSQFSYV